MAATWARIQPASQPASQPAGRPDRQMEDKSRGATQEEELAPTLYWLTRAVVAGAGRRLVEANALDWQLLSPVRGAFWPASWATRLSSQSAAFQWACDSQLVATALAA